MFKKVLYSLLLLPVLVFAQQRQTVGEPADTLVQNNVRVDNYFVSKGTTLVEGDLVVSNVPVAKLVADSVVSINGIRNEGTLRQKGNVLIALGSSPTTVAKAPLHIDRGGMSTVNYYSGIRLSNPDAATVGVQALSPALVFKGSAWKTDPTAGSDSILWAVYALPEQGAAAPTSALYFVSKIGSAAWNNRLVLNSAGTLSFNVASIGNYTQCSYFTYPSSVNIVADANNSGSDGVIAFGRSGYGSMGTEYARFTHTGNFGISNINPQHLVDINTSTGGFATGQGINLTHSGYNKNRTTATQAADTSSVNFGVGTNGYPWVKFKAHDGDSLCIWSDGTNLYLNTNSAPLKIGGTAGYLTTGGSTGERFGWNSTSFYPVGTQDLGTTANKFRALYTSTNIYHGGKGQTATMIWGQQNTMTEHADSTGQLTMIAGDPWIRLRASDGDSLSLITAPAYSGIISKNELRLGSGGVFIGFDGVYLYPSTNNARTIGHSSYRYLDLYMTRNQYIGGKGYTPALTIGTQNTMTEQTDSTMVFKMVNGNPVIDARNGNSVASTTNDRRQFYFGADTLALFNGARTGRDSSWAALVNGNVLNNGMVTIKRAVSLADQAEYTPQIPSGMCGWGTVQIGNEVEWARFRFKADGTVTLEANSTNVGTTNDTDTKLNIYDAGTSGIVIENQLGSTLTAAMVIECYTP